jgi:hypothetical protein
MCRANLFTVATVEQDEGYDATGPPEDSSEETEVHEQAVVEGVVSET